MYENYVKEYFEKFKDKDFDYLLICRNNIRGYDWAYSFIPYDMCYETIEEAIEWHFKEGWDIVEIYDLYQPKFEISMIRSISKGIYQIELIGDIVEINLLP